MSSAPPIVPPRRKQRGAGPSNKAAGGYDYEGDPDAYAYETTSSYEQSTTARYGKGQSSSAYDYEDDPTAAAGPNSLPRNILDDTPETTIGKQVKMKGELEFGKLLRVDGSFEGKLISKGDLVVGKTGTIIGDIDKMGIVVNEGKIIGNVTVDRIELKGKATIHGNITCKSLKVDPTVVIVGTLNVNPFAPSQVDPQGNIVGGSDSTGTSLPAPSPAPAPQKASSKAAPPAEGGKRRPSEA